MTNSIIKLMLVGDYSIFRSALRMLLETDKRLRVIGEAASLDAVAEIASKERPDLLLVDLPDFGGESIFPFLRNLEIPVLILVGQHDVGMYQKCLSHGISGLILKEASSDTLFRAIEKIYCGEIWFDRVIMSETIRQLLFERQTVREQTKVPGQTPLTDREKQVVELICKGMKNKGIAERLSISETTVRHHLSSVFGKLKITSRLELVIYAFNNEVVPQGAKHGSRPRNGNGTHSRNGFRQPRTEIPAATLSSRRDHHVDP